MRKKRSIALIFILIFVSIIMTSCSSKDTVTNEEEKWLYPAYKTIDNIRLWGYIDKESNFVIEPKFEYAGEFDENGLAKISSKGYMGLINFDGDVVVSPIYEGISDVKDGVFSTKRGMEYTIFDKDGKELFKTVDYMFIGESSEGLIPFAKGKNEDMRMGFIDKNENVIIEPEYSYVWEFKNGKALVQTTDEKELIIDKNGKVLTEMKYENVFPDEKNETFTFMEVKDDKNIFGYLDDKGNVLIQPKFNMAESFEDDMAVVGIEDKSKEGYYKYGIIDKGGEFIVEPQYSYISYLGDGLFAVAQDEIEPMNNSIYTKKAIMNNEGKILSDFKYYNIGNSRSLKFENGYISVSDGEKTYFLNTKGEKASEYPTLDGNGELGNVKGVVIANVDGRLSYYDSKGKAIWEEDRTYKLMGESVVSEMSYVPDMYTIIHYPQIEKYKDEKVQKKINDELYKKFVGDPLKNINEEDKKMETVNIDYDVRRSHDMLVVKNIGYYYMMGAAHGMPAEETYHIDLNTGKFYELKDLFKADSNYVDRLSSIIKEQMEKKSNEGTGFYFMEDFNGIRPDQNFTLYKDYIQIYFYPYEIASYAEGFQRFNIPYTEIKDILDENSELWWAFMSTKGN